MQTCPIKNTHKRLNRVLGLLTDLAISYQEPEDFTQYLNAVIQEIRNVTFVLQAEKRSITDFDNWYSKWQKMMREDTKLKWLHDARNIVVKQKDLEVESIAEVNILTYNDYPIATFKSPVMIPNLIIVKKILEESTTVKDDPNRDLLMLAIERRWIVPEFPGADITEILVHCLKFLTSMIEELHSNLGVKLSTCELANDQQDTKLAINSLITEQFRQAFYKVSTQEKILPEMTKLEITPELMQAAKKRYKFLSDIKPRTSNGKIDILGACHESMEMAQMVLRKDGYHTAIAFLLDESGSTIEIIPSLPDEHSDKYILMRELAKAINNSQAYGLIFVTESWVAPYATDNGKIIRPTNSPLRKEALTVFGLLKTGERAYLSALFTKNFFGKISFADIEKLEDHKLAFMNPVLKIWNLPTYSDSP